MFSDWGYRKPTRVWGHASLRKLEARVCEQKCGNMEWQTTAKGARWVHKSKIGATPEPGKSKPTATQAGRVPENLVLYLLSCQPNLLPPPPEIMVPDGEQRVSEEPGGITKERSIAGEGGPAVHEDTDRREASRDPWSPQQTPAPIASSSASQHNPGVVVPRAPTATWEECGGEEPPAQLLMPNRQGSPGARAEWRPLIVHCRRSHYFQKTRMHQGGRMNHCPISWDMTVWSIIYEGYK